MTLTFDNRALHLHTQVLRFMLGFPAKLRAWIERMAAQHPDDDFVIDQTESFCLGHNKARLRSHHR